MACEEVRENEEGEKFNEDEAAEMMAGGFDPRGMVERFPVNRDRC